MIRPTIQLAPADAAAFLEGLVNVNVHQMQRLRPLGSPSVREMIESGQLRYHRHDPDEHWQPYEEVTAGVRTWGQVLADCEDISSLVAAEYRYTGEDPGARVWVYRTGPSVSHVVVRRSDGRLEDPNITAGMGR